MCMMMFMGSSKEEGTSGHVTVSYVYFIEKTTAGALSETHQKSLISVVEE